MIFDFTQCLTFSFGLVCSETCGSLFILPYTGLHTDVELMPHMPGPMGLLSTSPRFMEMFDKGPHLNVPDKLPLPSPPIIQARPELMSR